MTGLPHRRDVVQTLLAERADLLLVAGLGSPAWDVTAAGDRAENYPLWGGMGGAACIALGVAIAQPTRPVACITGDGEMLMGLGSLATVAAQAPANLTIIVLDNEHYGETGMQLTHTAYGVDLAGVARAAGFPQVFSIGEGEGEVLEKVRTAMHSMSGPVFASVKVDPEKLPLVLPPRESSFLKNRFRIAVLGESAVHDN